MSRLVYFHQRHHRQHERARGGDAGLAAAGRLAVPFHYGLWRDDDYGEGATLDPQLFVGTYNRLNPEGHVLVLEPAVRVDVAASGLDASPAR